MRRLILIILLLNVTAVLCKAQQPTNDDIESFASELVASPVHRRSELLAARPAFVTIDLRKALVNRANLSFANTRYTTALNIYELAEKVAAQINDKDGIATASLNMASIYYFMGHHELAVERYRKAESVFTSIGKRADAARARVGLGLTYQAQQKPTEALQSFAQALKEFEALKDSNEIPTTLAHIGSLQYELGNYEAAAKAFLRIREWTESGDNLVRIAEAFYMQYEYAQSLVYYKTALEFFEQRQIKPGMIGAIAGIGNSYYNQRNYDEALTYYKRGLALEEELNDKSGIATRLQSIGNVYRAQGDYASALESYSKSLAVAAESRTQATVATTLGHIGFVRALQGDNPQAIEYFDRSLKEFESNGDQVGMARMLSMIGNVRYVQGMYDLALESYQKSRVLHEARGDVLNHAYVLVGIGTVYVNKKDYGPALQHYQRAISIYENMGRSADIADTLSRVAGVYRLQTDHTRSLEAADKAVRLARRTNTPNILSNALTEMGKAQRSLKRQAEALVAFEEAIRIQQTLRADVSPEGFEAERSGVLPYLGAMETLLDQGNLERAFERAEDAKSQYLFELLHQGNFTVTKDLTAQEQTEERRLIGDLISLKLQMTRVQDSNKSQAARLENIRSRVTAAATAFQTFRRGLYARHPQLKTNRGELPPFTLESARPFLSNNAALLEYVITDDSVLLFVITANQTRAPRATPIVTVYRLSLGRGDVAVLAQRFQQAITSRDNTAVQTARELYDVLLKPAEEQLAGKSKLIIVPHGVLWEIPFEALQTSDQYLLDKASISYAVSLLSLGEMRKRAIRTKPAGQGALLAFGSPALPECCVMQRVQTLYKGVGLTEVSSESPEIEKLQATYKDSRSRFYTGADARTSRVTADAKNYNILHFGTPTILDHYVPMQSQMIFSPDSDAQGDGVLKLWEVTKLNSKARVVVLANSTIAQSHAQTGNAFIALSWAWFVAGTPAVVLRRWQPDASSVADHVTEFHRELKQSKTSPAETLRESTLKLKRRPGLEDPSHWTAFMIMGGAW